MIVKEWINKLGLNDIPIEINTGVMDQDILYHFSQNVGGICRYDTHLKTYFIYYKNGDNFIKIHELGHVFFDVKSRARDYDLEHYIIINMNIEKENQWRQLDIIRNCLLDTFNHYNLTKFEGFYPLLLQNFPNGKYKQEKLNEIVDQYIFIRHLSGYIFNYLHLNYILNVKDYQERCDNIRFNLLFLQKVLFIKAKKEGINFTHKQLANLHILLDQFSKVKGLSDYKLFITYLYKVLMSIGLWLKEEILEYFSSFVNVN